MSQLTSAKENRTPRKGIIDWESGLELHIIQVLRYGPPKSGMGKAVVKSSFEVELVWRRRERAGLIAYVQERRADLRLAEAKKVYTAWKREHFKKSGIRL